MEKGAGRKVGSCFYGCSQAVGIDSAEAVASRFFALGILRFASTQSDNRHTANKGRMPYNGKKENAAQFPNLYGVLPANVLANTLLSFYLSGRIDLVQLPPQKKFRLRNSQPEYRLAESLLNPPGIRRSRLCIGIHPRSRL